jgi:hypothetical protein
VITHKHYDRISKKIGREFEAVCRDSEVEAAQEEHDLALAAGEEVVDGCVTTGASEDGSWTKRSNRHSYNSLNGGVAAFGQYSRKMIDHVTFNKRCAICESAKRRNKPVSASHVCRKNHSGSAKSMESVGSLLIHARAPEKRLRLMRFIGDEDTTTIARLVADLPSKLAEVEKHSDGLHVRRILHGKLLELQKAQSDPVFKEAHVGKLVRDFRYAAYNSQGDADGFSVAVDNVVPHNFDEHAGCGEWCKVKLDPSHKPALPGGEYLVGERLKRAIAAVFAIFSDPLVAAKLCQVPGKQIFSHALTIKNKK